MPQFRPFDASAGGMEETLESARAVLEEMAHLETAREMVNRHLVKDLVVFAGFWWPGRMWLALYSGFGFGFCEEKNDFHGWIHFFRVFAPEGFWRRGKMGDERPTKDRKCCLKRFERPREVFACKMATC